MKKCLVSLVSEQTIPNLLLAIHFKPDYLLFITTEKMEKQNKTQAILNTLKLRHLDYDQRHHKVEVQEDSIIDLQTKVSQWLSQIQEDYQFVVNITGGTKIMSLATYDFFKEVGSDIIYVPIPQNKYLIPFPKLRPKPPGVISERLTVREYLTACNFIIPNPDTIEKNRQRAFSRKELTKFIFDHYQGLKPLLKRLWQKLPMKYKNELEFNEQILLENEEQKCLLKKLGFLVNENNISKKINKSEWYYLRGGWLEERLFLAVAEVLSPEKGDVQLGVNCMDQHKNENEFDVLFTFENVLYLIECKSLDPAESKEDRIGITDFLYKLGALRPHFGLTPRAFFASTSENLYDDHGELKSKLIDRAKQSNTEIIPLLKITDLEGYFRNIFF